MPHEHTMPQEPPQVTGIKTLPVSPDGSSGGGLAGEALVELSFTWASKMVGWMGAWVGAWVGAVWMGAGRAAAGWSVAGRRSGAWPILRSPQPFHQVLLRPPSCSRPASPPLAAGGEASGDAAAPAPLRPRPALAAGPCQPHQGKLSGLPAFAARWLSDSRPVRQLDGVPPCGQPLRVHVAFIGCRSTAAVAVMQVGVSNLAARGTVRIAIKPLLDELPVAGGVKASGAAAGGEWAPGWGGCYGQASGAMPCHGQPCHAVSMPCGVHACRAWHGMDAASHAMTPCGMACPGRGIAWHGTSLGCMAWHGMAWHGMAWHGMAWVLMWRAWSINHAMPLYPAHVRLMRVHLGRWPHDVNCRSASWAPQSFDMTSGKPTAVLPHPGCPACPLRGGAGRPCSCPPAAQCIAADCSHTRLA